MPCSLPGYPLPVSPGLSPAMATGALQRAQVVPPPAFILQSGVEPVHDPQGVMQGLLIKKIAPDDPPLALQARIEGTTISNVETSKSGDVVSTSLFSGHPMLAAAAVKANGAVTKGPRLARRGPT